MIYITMIMEIIVLMGIVMAITTHIHIKIHMNTYTIMRSITIIIPIITLTNMTTNIMLSQKTMVMATMKMYMVSSSIFSQMLLEV